MSRRDMISLSRGYRATSLVRLSGKRRPEALGRRLPGAGRIGGGDIFKVHSKGGRSRVRWPRAAVTPVRAQREGFTGLAQGSG